MRDPAAKRQQTTGGTFSFIAGSYLSASETFYASP